MTTTTRTMTPSTEILAEDKGTFHVSATTLKQFVAEYPRVLSREIDAASNPPVVSFNDHSHGAVWPESVVASFTAPAKGVGDQPTNHRIFKRWATRALEAKR